MKEIKAITLDPIQNYLAPKKVMSGESMMPDHKKSKSTIMYQPVIESDESFEVQSKQSQNYQLNSSELLNITPDSIIQYEEQISNECLQEQLLSGIEE